MATAWKGNSKYQVEQEVGNEASIPEKKLRFKK